MKTPELIAAGAVLVFVISSIVAVLGFAIVSVNVARELAKEEDDTK